MNSSTFWNKDASSNNTQPNLSIYQGYFTEFLPSIIGQLLIEDLKSLSCCVEISVTDSGAPPWRIVVDSGRLSYVGRVCRKPECRYVLELETLIQIIGATRSPQDAFFDTDIEIEGDIHRGLELSSVLEEFFTRFPYHGNQ